MTDDKAKQSEAVKAPGITPAKDLHSTTKSEPGKTGADVKTNASPMSKTIDPPKNTSAPVQKA